MLGRMVEMGYVKEMMKWMSDRLMSLRPVLLQLQRHLKEQQVDRANEIRDDKNRHSVDPRKENRCSDSLGHDGEGAMDIEHWLDWERVALMEVHSLAARSYD